MSKILVTSGCSFTQPGYVDHLLTWSNYLEQNLSEYDAIHLGLSSQGNDLISRKAIFSISQLLKTHHPSELLVGIMWSGPVRHAILMNTPIPNFPKQLSVQENPTAVADKKKWYILAPGTSAYQGKDNGMHSRIYYEYMYDYIGSLVETCEHILRTQWFLEKHNINYFMSTFTGKVLSDAAKTNNETKHLYEQINLDTFLPVVGEHEWCDEHSGLPFPKKDDMHPGPLQHKKFTDEIIMPFLKEKQYI